MPRRPLHPCNHPGCRALVDVPYCADHKRDADQRLSARDRGYNSRWERSSKGFIRVHPLCFYCELQDRTTATECVDHATPPSGPTDPLFWDVSNWRPACIRCNSAKGHRDERTYLASIGLHPS